MSAPTLIVSAGGVGCRVAAMVAAHTSPAQRENLRFVALDTDANDLRALRAGGYPGKVIQTSANMTVKEYLHIDKHAAETWFPVHPLLGPKALTEGAAQVRSISRLALNTTIRSGRMQPLHDAIDELYRLTGRDLSQAMRVIVVSSLAGGTGSGILLELGMYIRHYLLQHCHQSSAIIRGFFLLPEVFYSVTEDENERNSLRCNAYATLRELDAFLMRADGVLPARYSSLRLEFPKPGSFEWEDYNVSPYDFCFLFDGQNMNGARLPTFKSYLEHAANCIYAQSISSISERSNSSEDNVIRPLIAARGRNRYCGAGSAILEYPYEDVREYIALKWAQNSMSNHWLLADQIVDDKKRAHQRKLDEGFTDSDFDDIGEYIAAVENSENGFQKMIRAQCQFMDPDHPSEVQSDLWSNYLDSLVGYIERQVEERQPDLEESRSTILSDAMIQRSVMPLENQAEPSTYPSKVLALYQQLENYYDESLRTTDSMAEDMAYGILHSVKDPIREPERSFLLESFLRRQSGVIHPNAIRYMLCKTSKALDEYIEHAHSKVQEASGVWKRFETVFNDPSDEKINSVQDLVNSVYTKKKGMRSGWSVNEDAQEKLKTEFTRYAAATTNYRKYRTIEVVAAQVGSYVRDLIEAFTVFYGTLQNQIADLEERQDILLSSHENDIGYARRLCCCSPRCMEALYNEAPVTGSLTALPGELSALIYSRVREFSLQTAQQRRTAQVPRRRSDGRIHFEDFFQEENGAGSAYFTRIFDEVVLGYWKQMVRHKADSLINMDIIDALEKEAEIEHGCVDLSDKRDYAIRVIQETQRLATPFIEKSYSTTCRMINGCTYSTKLAEKDYEHRRLILDGYLKGAVPGDGAGNQVDKYQIVFYQSVYCIRAMELPKFSAPVPALNNETGGTYYKSYFEVIRQISCNPQETLVVSPHLNRRWHLVSELPDLDEENMKRQEKGIMKAFLRGLMLGRLCYEKKSRLNEERRYILQLKLPGGEYWPEELPVPSGSLCDQLYEVYDALVFNPPIVDALNEDYEQSRVRERQENVSLQDSRFMIALGDFTLPEIRSRYGLENVGLLDLPLLYKLNAPRPVYQEECAVLMLETFLEEMLQCLTDHLEQADVPQIFAEELQRQTDLFFRNLNTLSARQNGLRDDSLLRFYRQTLVEMLEAQGRYGDAQRMEARFRRERQ
ncbi:MAG: tubulin-like doman-containing protein [Oscillospiraceae bacterium]|nr:tubulin-like doman-containing protein [Oscillospiraceae bacterium]